MRHLPPFHSILAASAIQAFLIAAAPPAVGGDGSGAAAGSAGEVNGDGFDDLIVGARYFSGGAAIEGRAYVFHGGPGF